MTGHDDDHGPDGAVHEHDRGLSHDLPTLLSRRRMLALAGAAGLATLAACSSDSTKPSSATPSASATTPASTPSATAAAAGTKIPSETGGPFPGDGSNGVNVLTASGIVRGDLTRSFGGASGLAQGVPLTITLKVLDTANGSAALAGAAVYIWHCDREGRYSLYSDGVTDENYLRGVQEADSSGGVTFRTIYPAAYQGRWPHVHFEVYPTLAEATTAAGKLRTSQLALPENTSKLVYATSGYGDSVQNLAQTSLASDSVFRDGYSLQLANVTGTVEKGLTATLNVPV
jgi:protocatechuate 3,4-dioxygenase beta subunit